MNNLFSIQHCLLNGSIQCCWHSHIKKHSITTGIWKQQQSSIPTIPFMAIPWILEWLSMLLKRHFK